MSKMTKALLVLSLVGLVSGFAFVSGVVNVGEAVGLYAALPMGAIFFGLFLISKLLEKEVAIYDAELSVVLKTAKGLDGKKPVASKPGCERSAHSHKASLASAH
jgi:hypothetical protein